MREFDLVIIGSGIVGSSLAYYSAKKDKKVLIIERNFTGYNSSGKAQGGLSPYLGDDEKSCIFDMKSFTTCNCNLQTNLKPLLHYNLQQNYIPPQCSAIRCFPRWSSNKCIQNPTAPIASIFSPCAPKDFC